MGYELIFYVFRELNNNKLSGIPAEALQKLTNLQEL